MVQKTFTMWPRINSSTASTVSFLTDEDNRFILFFLLAFYSDTLPHWRVKRNLRPCDRQCGNSSTLRLLKLEPAWRGLCRTHTSSTKRKDVFMARRLLATALPVSGRTSSPKGGTAFARIRALGRHLLGFGPLISRIRSGGCAWQDYWRNRARFRVRSHLWTLPDFQFWCRNSLKRLRKKIAKEPSRCGQIVPEGTGACQDTFDLLNFGVNM